VTVTDRPRLEHVPALDGLRGVAVVGVLAFHLGHLRGGYLGVDLFFVLSGFLITSLLLVEWRENGRIELRSFWARRARRLLPALLLLITAVAAYAATDPPAIVQHALRGDALATLGYIANWHAIVADHGYWELFSAPSLLAHTWSLAIEEQLYVVWPLVVVVALRFGRRALLWTALVLAAASAMAMVVVHGAGDDTSRVYFGTDTRAAAVLVGAALAAWEGRRPRVLQLAAIPLGVAWFTVAGTSNGLYEGGLALCSVAGMLVVAGVHQPGPLTSALSWRPLRRIGAISYGLYLWHWPAFVVLDSRTSLAGWPLLVVKLLVTVVISELSYRVLELPIRRGTLRGWRVRVGAPVAAGAAVVAVVAGTAAPAPAIAAVPAPREPAPASVRSPTTTRLLVLGDSGAVFLGEGLERAGSAHDLEVRNAGTISCGLLTDGGGLRLDGGGYLEDPSWCPGWPERWVAELSAFDPDLVLVVIGWPGLGDRRIDGEWRHPCDPVFDARYAEVVDHALGMLAAPGRRVVIADSPYLTLPVVQPDAATRVDCLNHVYERVADDEGASVLHIGEWLCRDQRRCTTEVDGVTLRPDGIHFRDRGADIAADWVIPQLLDG
jgi:peptidoglycan/LPS O-acetylase OafA/YrhL